MRKSKEPWFPGLFSIFLETRQDFVYSEKKFNMRFKTPKNTDQIFWTDHVKEKMKYYNLSETRLRRILRNPQRTEKGIAPRTVAIMQRTKSKRPSEIWLMYQKRKAKNQIKIISAWRYPGVSPEGPPPIPEEIIKELNL